MGEADETPTIKCAHDALVPGGVAQQSILLASGDKIKEINARSLGHLDNSVVQILHVKIGKVDCHIRAGPCAKNILHCLDPKHAGSLGMNLRKDIESGRISITGIKKGGAAYRHGVIRKGDIIVALPGLDVNPGVSVREVGKTIVLSGSVVKMKLMRIHRIKSVGPQRSAPPQQPQQQGREEKKGPPGSMYSVDLVKRRNSIGVMLLQSKIGVYIQSMAPGLPAATSGQIDAGDVIVGVNGAVVMHRNSGEMAMSISEIAERIRKSHRSVKLALVRGRGVAYAENYSPSATKSGNEKVKRESTLRPDHAACEVRSPSKLARLFRRDKTMSCQPAKFGAPLPRNGTVAEAVFASPLKGCDPLNVTANYSGKIVIVERGMYVQCKGNPSARRSKGSRCHYPQYGAV